MARARRSPLDPFWKALDRAFSRIFVCLVALWSVAGAEAQLTGIKNIPGNYATLALAISALNAQGVGPGGVTLNLIAGNPQTAPAGGYCIGGAGSLVFTTTSALNPVIVQGNGNVITAPNPQAAGVLTDAIIKLVGADWVTLTGLSLQEHAANTTTAAATNNMTEWGIALLYVSAANGAQNNTIQGNTIALKRIYPNTFGIYSNTNHTAVAPTVLANISAIAGSNSGNKIHGNAIGNVNTGISLVGSRVALYHDVGNDIGGSSPATGNLITNWGGNTTTSGYISNSTLICGISLNHQAGSNVSYNTLASAPITIPQPLRGILQESTITSPSTVCTNTISHNTITLTSSQTGVVVRAIDCTSTYPAPTVTLNITNNTIQNCALTGVGSTSHLGGIYNSGWVSILNISSNILRGNTSTAGSAGFTGISNIASVSGAVNIDNNQIGGASGGAITFSVATNGPITGITNQTLASPGSTATVSISGNNFQGIAQPGGSSIHMYVANLLNGSSGYRGSTAINNNTFTDLNAATSGAVYFIRTNASHANSTIHTINNNAIVGSFTKSAGNTVHFLRADGFGNSASISLTNTGNNFSNVTATGGTIIHGWQNVEGNAVCFKTVSNNIFTNIAGGTLANNLMDVSGGSPASTVSGNVIRNVTGTGTMVCLANTGPKNISGNVIAQCTGSNVIGMLVDGVGFPGALNIFSNTIDSLFASSFSAIGIMASDAVPLNIFNNKIHDLSGGGASGAAHGIYFHATDGAGTTSGTIHHNLIGSLRAPAAQSNIAVSGITVYNNSFSVATATADIYYNTIRLDATSSSATTFGSSALLVGHNSSTMPTVNVRNNIFMNHSTPGPTGGFSAAFRFLSTPGTSYAVLSNNNLFHAGVPAVNRVLYGEGFGSVPLNGQQTLAAYQGYMGPVRDDQSISVNPAFLSLSGPSPNFLHIDCTVPSPIESGAVNITGYPDDYDGEIRAGNPGYLGAGTAPDIGADEFECSIPLPVELLTFDAQRETGRVALTWSTASEINSDRFVIERSTDAEVFEPIGEVQAAGNSQVLLQYLFHDEQPLSAMTYYRLRQFDLDGSFTFSDVVAVPPIGISGQHSIYPNPFTEEVTLFWNADDAPVVVRMTDALGRVVFEKRMELVRGANALFDDGSPVFGAGVYLLSIISSGEAVVQRLVKR